MTLTQASASDPAALIREAIVLLDAATAQVDSTPSAHQPHLTSPGAALHLLITNCSADPDELPVPVVGARLIAVAVPAAAEQLRLQHMAELPRRAVETTLDGHWLVLFPGTPHQVGLDGAAREARRFLAALARCGGAVVVDDEWAALAVERLRRAARTLIPLRSPIEVLAAHDKRRGTDFGETLGTWLNLNCDTEATSRALGIHPNTLRYRLRRASALAGLNLSDPNVRLVLQLTQRITRPSEAE